MKAKSPPYGKARIGRVEPGPGETDAQAIDVRREGQLAGRSAESYQGVPPVKKSPWEWYIPIYFWAGGLAAGSWLAAACEDLAGENDRAVVRAGRYTALGSVLGGTVLLIADLGRPERFLNMLRVLRPTSAMSLGSWGLVGFGTIAGAGAALQAAEDGLLGRRPRLARLSRGGLGRAVHLAGIPAALFVGGYTGNLLSSTATPSWARRTGTLAPLFLASSTSNGMAMVSAIAEATGGASPSAKRRLSRAEAVALGGELALLSAERLAPHLPSERDEPALMRIGRALTIGAGVALPLALAVSKGARRTGKGAAAKRHAGRGGRTEGGWRRNRRHGAPEARDSRRSRTGLLTSALTLAGGLALRFLTIHEGFRSADTPRDTWAFAGDGRADPGPHAGSDHTRVPDRNLQGHREARGQPGRGEASGQQRRREAGGRQRRPGASTQTDDGRVHEVVGRITLVQEDRVRLVDDVGRGYLLVTRKRVASLDRLERWRDEGARLRVAYTGLPDAGALALHFMPE